MFRAMSVSVAMALAATKSALIGPGVRSAAVALTLAAVAAVAQAQSGTAQGKADIAKGQQIAGQACVACHGADGNSTGPVNPKLAAQHPEYLAKQLYDFRVAPGASGAARANPVMAGFAAALSDADIRDVSAFYASQPLKPAVAKDPSLVELGQQVYRAGVAEKSIPACAGCHGPTGAGIPAQYPRLQGQWAEYTAAQLTAYRQGMRSNSVQMVAIAARMSDLEIKAVSEYIAGLR